MNMTVDESLYSFNKPGGDRVAVKECSEFYGAGHLDSFGQLQEDNHESHPDPFLFSDTKVLTGWGKAMVCCVGNNTLLASTRKPQDLIVEEQETFLEKKLETAADQISKFAKLAAMLVVITRCLFLVGICIAREDRTLISGQSLKEVAETCIIAVVLLIVAVPEGLPLAVSIAMALSIKNLEQDEILIKNIDAVQTCAQFNDLFVGKTGTLTTGKLTVKKFQIGDQFTLVTDNENNWDKSDAGGPAIRNHIVQSIIALTDVRLEADDVEAKYVPKGSSIEVGMIKFLMANDCKAQENGGPGDGDDVPNMMRYVN